MCLSGLRRVDLKGRNDVPGQEFFDATDGMVWDLRQDSAKVELRIEAVQLGRANEAVKCGGTVNTAIGSCEELGTRARSVREPSSKNLESCIRISAGR